MIAWFAFALALIEFAFLLALVGYARWTWRQIRPTIEPMLGMFTQPPPRASGSASDAAGGDFDVPGDDFDS